MVDKTTQSGALSGEGSAQTPDDSSETNQQTPKTVSWEAHKRAIDDLHKYKRAAKEREEKLSEFEAQRLSEKEEFKSLAEKFKSERDEWKSKAEGATEKFLTTLKMSEVERVALSKGLRPEALKDLQLLDFNDIQIESTSSGRLNVLNVDEFVDSLKKDRQYWFREKNAPNINGGGGAGPTDTSSAVSPADVTKAERDYKMGKISKDQYVSIHNRYVSQFKGG